ncbi:hypothetical protein QFC24_006602 [Naganishia onofrii]|uniref:Uncharacterized protein n=1 Tax=Naganishia onofrii TaxID=1851511 RepID=A0ACC2WYS6_9TREE|nr:hypothetical protein QFC24_006602 [Naganishia onofrii]
MMFLKTVTPTSTRAKGTGNASHKTTTHPSPLSTMPFCLDTTPQGTSTSLETKASAVSSLCDSAKKSLDRFVLARGDAQPIDAHDLAAIEMVEAMRTGGQLNNMPFALWDNIARHDWSRSGKCVYTVVINGIRYRGTGESLVLPLSGFPRAACVTTYSKISLNLYQLIDRADTKNKSRVGIGC